MRTLGVVIAEGRVIDERDSATAPRAAVINETLARQFLPNQSALDRRIRFDPEGPWFTIVGVVKNVRERGYEPDDKPAAYVSSPQVGGSPANLIVRVSGEEAAVACANDTAYGLSSAVIGADVARALRVAGRIQSGICHINGPTVHDEPQMPFGGVKDSGYGRFGGKPGIEAFTDVRWVSVQTTPRAYPF